MISTSNHVSTHVHSLCFSSPTLPLIQFPEFHVWRRRRLKKLPVCCQLIPFKNLFQNLVTVNSPALDFVYGAALSLSRLKSKSKKKEEVSDLGEWILFTGPTPFNRFAFRRCPSITFEGSVLIEDSNEMFISGKIQVKELDEKDDKIEQDSLYQRSCVSTGDGGMISLDWPVKLELREERGMDTTVLLIPGTAEGSMSKNIRSFVCESLKRGCFPVVMNPRGCAGSPLTTTRLFTASDSDDVCTAIQFINKARPWNTLMAVGWGQGANMLTKYLAEVEERTPLTAATCIDNPFDLEEATKLFPYHVAVDQKLTSGLIDILRSNKELFQGREKKFNVEKALSATSLRDFEREISMVSYGFESIEEFYSKSSTRELVGNVKIPLLFIQSDDGTVPPFSIPRSSVAENPFTSMLLCSCLLSPALTSKKSLLPWCQHFAFEWLTAVELGFLKGRHPLLDNVNVSINPSIALDESRASSKDSSVNNILDVTEMNALNGYSSGSVENDVHLGSQSNISQSAESQEGENHEMYERNGSDDTALGDRAEENSADNERSQVLRSAQVVMNMLDASMPGALQEEQKKKVLSAMEKGETLKNALEGVLPEDVRGKLTDSVSEIVKSQGSKLSNGIMNASLVPIDPSEVKSKVEETFKGVSSAVVDSTDVTSPEQKKSDDEMPTGTDPESEAPESEADDVKMNVDDSNDENKPPMMEEEEDKNMQPTECEEAAPSPPPTSGDAASDVSQGLDALTETDDSTQVAVNSVFGVLENGIAKLEEEGGQEMEGEQDKSKDREPSQPSG